MSPGPAVRQLQESTLIDWHDIAIPLSVILGLVFLGSSVPKLRHPRGFVLLVLEYRVLPPTSGRLYGRVIPHLELLVGLLLITGVAVRLATFLAVVLILSFLAAVAINMARGRDLDCGCFGAARGRRIGSGLVIQDSVLLGVAVALFALAGDWMQAQPWSLFRLSPWLTQIPLGPVFACGAAVFAISTWLGRHNRRRWYADVRA